MRIVIQNKKTLFLEETHVMREQHFQLLVSTTERRNLYVPEMLQSQLEEVMVK